MTVGAAARECWRKRADSSLSGQDEGRERPGNASVELWRPSRMEAGTWGTQLCHLLPLGGGKIAVGIARCSAQLS